MCQDLCFMLFDDMVAEGTGWGYPFPSRFVVERYGQPPLCLWCFWNLATDLVLAAIALALAGWRLERWFGRLRRNATTPSREWSFAWRPALVVFCGLLITNLLWERQGGMSVLMGGY